MPEMTMDRINQRAKIRETISGIMLADNGIEDVDFDVDFREEYALDSLDVVELGISIDDKFQIDTDDADIEKLETLSDLVNLVESKIGR